MRRSVQRSGPAFRLPGVRAASRPRIFRAWRPALALLLILAIVVPQRDAQADMAAAPDGDGLPLRAWHFAEGNSRNGFETYFTLLNLTEQPASVMVNYNRDDGIRLVQWLGIEPRQRLSLNANEVVGARAFGASFYSDQNIIVERTTTWGPGQNAETTVGFAPDGRKGWYFAEGTTRGRVTTYFVTQNLTDIPANVTATFTRDDGSVEKRAYSVPPRARDAYRVNDLMQDTAFSASFRSDQDLVVERTIMTEGERSPTVKPHRTERNKANGQTDEGFAMARNAIGVFGGLGHIASGAEPGLRSWEFAEGSTRAPYRLTFVLFNPGNQGTAVRLRFQLEQGETRSHTLSLPAMSRAAFDPRTVVPAADFATSISADRPIVAERAYATSGDGLYGVLGHTASPPRSDSRAWYFAEGNTSSQIETFFVLFNLSTRPTQVRGTYFLEAASAREQHLTVPAGGRLAVRANEIVSSGAFSARFEADQNIMVERTLYFPGGSGFTTVGSGVGTP